VRLIELVDTDRKKLFGNAMKAVKNSEKKTSLEFLNYILQ